MENHILKIFRCQNVESEKSMKSFESAVFLHVALCYFNADWSYQTSNLWIIGRLKHSSNFIMWDKIFIKKLTFQVMSRTVPGSLWDVPGTSRASKNIKGMTKHPPKGLRKISEKWQKNPFIWRVLGSNFLNFPCWRMCCPSRGDFDDSQRIFCVLED